MNKYFIILLFFIGFIGCNFPTELPIPESAKPADKFSRAFLDKVINGQLESCFADIDPKILNDEARTFVTNASRNINGATVKKYRVVEVTYTTVFLKGLEKFINYRLGYEYEFENGNILLITSIKEKEGKFLVTAFNGEFLPAPLAKLTKFTLESKSIIQYIFLMFCILVPLFILTTFVMMLLSKITRKKKIIWTLVILIISFPKLIINWDNGQLDYVILNISFLGSGIGKPTLYSPWLLFFNIPIGAIVFWIKRKSLLPETIQEYSETADNDDEINKETIRNEKYE